MGIVVKSTPPNWTEFHTTTQIINSSIEAFERSLWEDWGLRNKLRNKLGITVSKLVNDLMNVEGVVRVWLKPYEIAVRMAPAFSWNTRIDRLIEDAVAQLDRGKYYPSNVLRIETFPNPGMRSFRTTQEVSRTQVAHFNRPLTRQDQSDLREVGTLGEQIVRHLFDIPGVTGVYIHPYVITVTIGKAFCWRNIESKVAHVILLALL